ncbi:galactoside O-acetyltransferase/maltose O-acetyltransferase [Hydrogenispora ethanolica]|uniref:Acetyltransferase n=1 Tax=Hydrogenispora ethanolica TaxID=1082276 RepID=A0A4R1R984_HYDET|nr:sugar O-acetyltransferase [Hydrogenispora ethanolica]TCL62263.1 galactoside O-acetyltransferase/maltose O-acetyltransferase [Hydrogenispora ethanolica]
MNQKDRMLAGLPYKAWLDGLPEERMENKKKLRKYNQCQPDERATIDELIRDILGKAGVGVHIEAPFYCDYGKNIEVGDYFFANYNCTILDVGKVIIGDNVQFAPNVSLYTAGHPLHPDSRNSGYEYGMSITIGNNVWLGGNVVVNPGVHIGDNVVIGSGSIVTRDIPDNVIAAGNPCKVIRKITEEDRKYYYKKYDADLVKNDPETHIERSERHDRAICA